MPAVALWTLVLMLLLGTSACTSASPAATKAPRASTTTTLGPHAPLRWAGVLCSVLDAGAAQIVGAGTAYSNQVVQAVSLAQAQGELTAYLDSTGATLAAMRRQVGALGVPDDPSGNRTAGAVISVLEGLQYVVAVARAEVTGVPVANPAVFSAPLEKIAQGVQQAETRADNDILAVETGVHSSRTIAAAFAAAPTCHVAMPGATATTVA